MSNLSNHEARIVDDMLGVIDYSSRVLIAASYGSMYQLDKARGLQRELERLVARLEEKTLSQDRSEAVTAAVGLDAKKFTLGRILYEAGHLGGTA